MMTSPSAIISAHSSWPKRQPSVQRQHGVTLIELLVGIAIGLLVVAVATGALMVSRGVSGTVSDASGIQQQAAYAMRVVGMQVRQAGSLYLNPNPTGVPASTAESYMQVVAFETQAEDVPGSPDPTKSFNPQTNTVKADATSLTTGFRRYKDTVKDGSSTKEQTLARNCLGGPSDDAKTDPNYLIESAFKFDSAKFELQCNGNSAGDQPIVQNIAEFQLRYLVQEIVSTDPGNPKIIYTSTVPSSWAQVQAIEVCMVLFGAEPIDMPANSNYKTCTDTDQDMTTLTGNRAKRMHMRFRSVFQLRSQGLVGSAIPAI